MRMMKTPMTLMVSSLSFDTHRIVLRVHLRARALRRTYRNGALQNVENGSRAPEVRTVCTTVDALYDIRWFRF